MSHDACHRVLLTPELLEIVLLHLDTRSLLHAQRISSHFCAVVQSSATLQRALFFSPLQSSKLSPEATRYECNPVLRAAFPSFFGQSMSDGRLKYAPDYWEYNKTLDEAWSTLSIEADRADNGRLQNAFREPAASWRTMLLTQPPITDLAVKVYFRSTGETRDHNVPVDSGGLKMLALYELIGKIVASAEAETSFALQWYCFPSRSRELIEHVPPRRVESFIPVEPYMADLWSAEREKDVTGEGFEPRPEVTIWVSHAQWLIM